MKKFNKFMMMPLMFLLIIPLILFTACGNNNNDNDNDTNNSGPAYYIVSFSGELPTGVTSISFDNNGKVQETHDASFYIVINNSYIKSSLKVFCNSTEISELRSERKTDGTYYYYNIMNVMENKTITMTGSPEIEKFHISGVWNEGSSSTKVDDKNIENFFVDYKFIPAVGTPVTKNFTGSSFKDYINSQEFNVETLENDVIMISVYSKDNYESFVDEFILCSGTTLEPTLENITENIDGTEVKYLKATYTFTVNSNQSLSFNEWAIVRSVELAKTYTKVEGVEYGGSTPKLVLRNQNGIIIDNYVDLKNAESIDAYIENVKDFWKPLLENEKLQYSLSSLNKTFVVEDGEYIFKNVGLPYLTKNASNYNLIISNAKELVFENEDFSKISLSRKNVYGLTVYSDEYISIKGEGNYYYTKCANNMLLTIKKDYTRLQIEFSNEAGESVTKIIVLSTSSQIITDGYAISEYFSIFHHDDTTRQFVLRFNGSGKFYNTIKLTALLPPDSEA